ncbi:hypothetical protein P154DRAFT_517819 [Amniculicola lignicola CBS 123094]|uniref:60S ribosomal subunit assembly/export protein loc1 n=1 Tax=Amniculicola lignicola CBS 123094 TaxID=1392246 RepID=A0A6A5WWK2_9PLEO|nr:hypothetical protein P154DRAFT_517819 [Amniculicola lignicola CBS 123094]
MAPIRSSKGAGKGGAKGGSKGGPKGGSSKAKGKSGGRSSKPTGSAPEGISKRKQKSMSLAKPGGAQKTKSKPLEQKKKKRVYTEKELDIPKLNGIIPAGVAKPKGQKIGKKFVDDPASMMAIMSMVNAEKEGHIESKIMRARQLEEVREAKKKEQEARSDEKKQQFEDKKQSMRKARKNRNSEPAKSETDENKKTPEAKFKPKKRVSFG